MTLQELNSEFKQWVLSHGAEIIPPTNEWEVLRLRLQGKIAIAWRNKKSYGYTSKANTEMLSLWRDYKARRSPIARASAPKKRRSQTIDLLLSRDGPNCFYCLKPLDEDKTIEHLVPQSVGGPNHPHNMVLTHARCNHEASDLPVTEKLLLRKALS